MKFQLLHKAVAGLLGSCAGVLLLTTLIVLGNSHVKKRLQLHLLDITCWVCQAQNENDTERILHAANPQVGTFHIYEWGHSGKSENAAGVALYLRKQAFRDYNVRRVYDIPSEYQGGWAYFGSKEVTVIFALSLHTLGYIADGG